MPDPESLTLYTSRTHLYLTIPIEGFKKEKAIELLSDAAVLRGATPHKDIDLACFLGETDGPTVYCLKVELPKGPLKKVA